MAPEQYLLIILLAAAPALFWLIIFYKKDYRDPEPKKVIAKAFIAGAFIAIPFLLMRQLMPPLTNSITDYGIKIFAYPALEEMAKLVAAIWVVNRSKASFNQLIDGAVYAISVALGFAFIENLIYFEAFVSASASGVIYVAAFRSLGTMLAHALFSGLAGLLWAYAYFSKDITNKNTKGVLAFRLKDFINHEIMTLHILRRNIFMAHPSRRGGHEEKILVLEGIFLATVLHVLYNFIIELQLFGQSLAFLLVPALMLGLLWISYEFARKFNQKMFKVV